jgi:hypothetical protein
MLDPDNGDYECNSALADAGTNPELFTKFPFRDDIRGVDWDGVYSIGAYKGTTAAAYGVYITLTGIITN